MIQRHFIVGIHALWSEVAVAGIAHQQALAFQVTANPLGDGMGQLSEFIIGWRFNPAKPCGSVITADVHAVQKEHVEVDVEIKGPSKSLNQGDGPGMCGGFRPMPELAPVTRMAFCALPSPVSAKTD